MRDMISRTNFAKKYPVELSNGEVVFVYEPMTLEEYMDRQRSYKAHIAEVRSAQCRDKLMRIVSVHVQRMERKPIFDRKAIQQAVIRQSWFGATIAAEMQKAGL